MTQFEVFCAVFYALDSVWEKTGGEQFRKSGFEDGTIQNEDLRQFLSDANPFLWETQTSADPAMFPEFCSIIQQEEIPIEDSYSTAAEYINSLQYYYASGVREAFSTITPEIWLDGVKRYMSAPHKGGSQNVHGEADE